MKNRYIFIILCLAANAVTCFIYMNPYCEGPACGQYPLNCEDFCGFTYINYDVTFQNCGAGQTFSIIAIANFVLGIAMLIKPNNYFILFTEIVSILIAMVEFAFSYLSSCSYQTPQGITNGSSFTLLKLVSYSLAPMYFLILFFAWVMSNGQDSEHLNQKFKKIRDHIDRDEKILGANSEDKLEVKVHQYENDELTLNIITASEGNWQIKLTRDDTIKTLKSMMSERTLYSSSFIKLVYEGRLLNSDDCTLGSLGIEDKGQISMILAV